MNHIPIYKRGDQILAKKQNKINKIKEGIELKLENEMKQLTFSP